MGRYLIRRLVFALVLVQAVSSMSLVLICIAGADTSLDPIERQRIEQELGLDRPFATQYVEWLGRALRFNFGRSLLYNHPVSSLLGTRALNTIVLATTALL